MLLPFTPAMHHPYPCPHSLPPASSPPPAGWLFKKLYGRLPGDSDRAVMYDPDLEAEYRFDITFIGAGGCREDG